MAIRNLIKFDIVVFACTKEVGEQSGDWRRNLQLFVKAGGSIVMLHDSCGYAHCMSPELFPEVAKTTGRYTDSPLQVTREGGKILNTSIKEFKLSWHRYVAMEKGVNGDVLAVDTKGRTSIVISKNRRVVAIGFLPGLKGRTTPGEIEILNSCIMVLGNSSNDFAGLPEGAVDKLKEMTTEIVVLKEEVRKMEDKIERMEISRFNENEYVRHGGPTIEKK